MCAGIQDCTIPDVPEGEPEHYTDSLLVTHLHPVVRHTVAWLQYWAKTGQISTYVIERRLNMYLALPGLIEQDEALFAYKPWFGLMYIEDAPSFENIPNLWHTLSKCLQNITAVRKKNVHRDMLYQLLTHALPCFHQTNKVITVDKHVSVALNVLLAMLLGLYHNVNRKPHFVVRVHFFRAVHVLHTSSRDAQQRFFSEHPNLFILAFMEYVAQLAPMFWPVEYQFLLEHNNLDTFFAKIPLLCDDFRVFDVNKLDWAHLEQEADSRVHKCSRSRRLHRAFFAQQQQHALPNHVSHSPLLDENEDVNENGNEEDDAESDHSDNNNHIVISEDEEEPNNPSISISTVGEGAACNSRKKTGRKTKKTSAHAEAARGSHSAASHSLVLGCSSGVSHWRKRVACDVQVFLQCPVIVTRDSLDMLQVSPHVQSEQLDVQHHLLAHAFQAAEQVLRDGHSLVQVCDNICIHRKKHKTSL